jgi:hypothetical protein
MAAIVMLAETPDAEKLIHVVMDFVWTVNNYQLGLIVQRVHAELALVRIQDFARKS